MSPAMLLLSVLIALPDQTTAPVKRNGLYREDQNELAQIHDDLIQLKHDHIDEIIALNDQVAQIRNRDGTLLSRLRILRQSARMADVSCELRIKRLQQWEEVYNRRPDPQIYKLFHDDFLPADIIEERALARKLFYMEIMHQRWNWEKEHWAINYRIVEGLGKLCAGGDGDKVLLAFGWIDVVVTDLCSSRSR